MGCCGSRIAVVAGDSPVEEHVLHLGALANVMDDHIAARGRLVIHNHANMGNAVAQIPCNEIAGMEVRGHSSRRQGLAFAAEKHHQIWDATMIDVGICMEKHPPYVVGILPEVGLHILVHFFLKVDTDGAINTDDFVCADAGVAGNVAIGIWDAHVGRVVANSVVRAFDRGSD